jgi:hypothetical protein
VKFNKTAHRGRCPTTHSPPHARISPSWLRSLWSGLSKRLPVICNLTYLQSIKCCISFYNKRLQIVTLVTLAPNVGCPYRMPPRRWTLLEEDIQRVVKESVIEDLPYISKTDASSHALRACLLQHLRKIADTLNIVRETSERQQNKVKKYADLRRRPSPPFEVGDRVLVDVHALSKASHSYTSKFAPRRDRPYVVIEKKGPVAYVVAAVDDPDRPLGKYHVSALRPFVTSLGETHSEPVAPLRRRGRPRMAQPDGRPEDEATSYQPRSPPHQTRGVRRGRRGAARPREDQI